MIGRPGTVVFKLRNVNGVASGNVLANRAKAEHAVVVDRCIREPIHGALKCALVEAPTSQPRSIGPRRGAGCCYRPGCQPLSVPSIAFVN